MPVSNPFLTIGQSAGVTQGNFTTLNVTGSGTLSISGGVATLNITGGGGGSGTVTSVALSDGSTTPIYSISGSPVTTSGTLTFTLTSQSANTVFAAPNGSSGQPSFRALVTADLPTLTQFSSTTTASGVVPGSNSVGTGYFLQADGTWVQPSGGGGVTSVSGTTNEITATGSASVTLSLPSSLVLPGLIYNTVNASVTAAGTTQGTATALTAAYNIVTTTPSNSGVILPTPAAAGVTITVLNQGANVLNVYPASGGTIQGSALNAPAAIYSYQFTTLTAVSTTLWNVTGGSIYVMPTSTAISPFLINVSSTGFAEYDYYNNISNYMGVGIVGSAVGGSTMTNRNNECYIGAFASGSDMSVCTSSTSNFIRFGVADAAASTEWLRMTGTATSSTSGLIIPQFTTAGILSNTSAGKITTATPTATVKTRTTVAPVTGFSNTISSTTTPDNYYIVNPAGTLATGTIKMPATPVDGQSQYICFNQTITTLTISPNTSQTIKNAPTTAAQFATYAWVWDSSETSWIRLQ